jgi:hypothetical protein
MDEARTRSGTPEAKCEPVLSAVMGSNWSFRPAGRVA